MTITILFFVIVCVVAGFAITLLSGLKLTIEERLFFGAVIGLAVVTTATFGFFLAFGMGPVSLGLGLGLTVVLGTVGFFVGPGTLASELREFTARWTSPLLSGNYPWPLWLLLLICWTYTLQFFSHAYVLDDKGLNAGYINIWGDWAAHLSYAGSFAYGDNRPPEFFIDPGNRLGYAFAIDFLAGMLARLGATLPNALVISSTAVALVFPGVMYCAGVRLVRNQGASALAVLIFAMMGGIGFIHFLADVDKEGMAALVTPPHEYTLNRDLGYQWLDPVLAYLVPQRSVLFGFSLILISVTFLSIVKENLPSGGLGLRHKRIRPLIFTGVMVGLVPAFHPYAYGTAIALAAVWALVEREGSGIWWRSCLRGVRSQLPFLIPALALGLPILLWLLPANGGDSVRFLPGWLAFTSAPGKANPSVPLPDLLDWLRSWLAHGMPGLSLVNLLSWIWFWIKNLSLFLPLLLVAQFWKGVVPDRFRLRFMPLWLWFVAPNLFVFQPWEWDNTKFFIFWALFGSMLVAALVVRIGAQGLAGRLLAASCMICLVLAGGIDLYRASDYANNAQNFTDAAGVRVAAWIRDNTDPRATFLVAHEFNQPVMALGGRRVVVGFTGWLWSYGVSDWYTRQQDVERMLRADPGTPELVRRYRVDYMVIGPQESSDQYRANVAYWTANGTQVHMDGDYVVLKLKSRLIAPGITPQPTDRNPAVLAGSGPHELGDLSGIHDLNYRCMSLGYQQVESTDGTWICQGKTSGGSSSGSAAHLDMDAACVWAYGKGATAFHRDYSNPYSWVCVRHE